METTRLKPTWQRGNVTNFRILDLFNKTQVHYSAMQVSFHNF